MNKIFFIFILLFPLSSFAKWTMIGTNLDSTTFYVDLERIKKLDGFIYYWELANFSKPRLSYLSVKSFRKVDCKLLGSRTLTVTFYKEPMGAGTLSKGYDTPDKEWGYSPPQSIGEDVLKTVCSY